MCAWEIKHRYLPVAQWRVDNNMHHYSCLMIYFHWFFCSCDRFHLSFALCFVFLPKIKKRYVNHVHLVRIDSWTVNWFCVTVHNRRGRTKVTLIGRQQSPHLFPVQFRLGMSLTGPICTRHWYSQSNVHDCGIIYNFGRICFSTRSHKNVIWWVRGFGLWEERSHVWPRYTVFKIHR